MEEHARDIAMAAMGKNMAVTGGSSAIVFGLAASDIAAFGGLAVALIGLCIQFYYKRRSDRRDAEYHAERMSELRRDG